MISQRLLGTHTLLFLTLHHTEPAALSYREKGSYREKWHSALPPLHSSVLNGLIPKLLILEKFRITDSDSKIQIQNSDYKLKEYNTILRNAELLC